MALPALHPPSGPRLPALTPTTTTATTTTTTATTRFDTGLALKIHDKLEVILREPWIGIDSWAIAYQTGWVSERSGDLAIERIIERVNGCAL